MARARSSPARKSSKKQASSSARRPTTKRTSATRAGKASHRKKPAAAKGGASAKSRSSRKAKGTTGAGKGRSAKRSRGSAKRKERPVAGALKPEEVFGISTAEPVYGVGGAFQLVEAWGSERRSRTGKLRRLYRKPAQRPRRRFVESASDDAIAKLFGAFGHPHRVAIIKAIFSGAGRYADLRERVPLKPGPMYHHLKELRLAGVLADGPRDVYALTPAGRDALILTCCLTDSLASS